MDFVLHSKYQPCGDQPTAIKKLVDGLNDGLRTQVLRGVTGSGKTFTMANVIANVNRPALVVCHNKTLAAQLCNEFREFFPQNRVEFFVSYYDYYMPESYIPSRDLYIEKEIDINDEIDKLRHSATCSLFERRDTIVVASVSCIYGLGAPGEYYKMSLSLRPGDNVSREDVIKKLVFEQKKFTLGELRDALINNFGKITEADAERLTVGIAQKLAASGVDVNDRVISEIYKAVKDRKTDPRYAEIYDLIGNLEKFGNDIPEVDAMAREAAYTYTRPLLQYKNPRGGQFQAGLYPVSANVPLGAQTGATPDGRYAGTPVADGVSPSAGKDVHGPTSAANSVSCLDHGIASNGTLFNMKFHPSALAGESGLENFVALVQTYFEMKGSHMQFNVVSRETLRDAQKNPDNYRSLVVRVAGYSALFTTLSKSLQDDIINRTEQAGF